MPVPLARVQPMRMDSGKLTAPRSCLKVEEQSGQGGRGLQESGGTGHPTQGALERRAKGFCVWSQLRFWFTSWLHHWLCDLGHFP